MRSLFGVLLLVLVMIAPPAARAAESEAGQAPVYILDKGDKLKVLVFGEEDLSGEFTVDTLGAVSLPLVGQLVVGGMGVREVEAAVQQRLSDGYLRNPRVSVQVLNYRPFYILGEVVKPGAYPYADGMRVNNAVAVGGGFTYRAKESGITITRTARSGEKAEFKAQIDTFILPGDVIKVDERFF